MRPPGWADRLLRRTVPVLGAGLIRLLGRTVKVVHLNEEPVRDLVQRGEPVIIAFWHGRLLMMHHSYLGAKAKILISYHQDGELISRTMVRLGHQTVRGSSSRGGSSAIRGMVRSLREGYDVAITPDGPRGPRQIVQPGTLEIARLSGCPVVPLAFGAHPALRLNSWDAFLVPLPWAQGAFVWGPPLTVPRNVDQAELEQCTSRLQRTLNLLTARVDQFTRGEVSEVRTDDL